MILTPFLLLFYINWFENFVKKTDEKNKDVYKRQHTEDGESPVGEKMSERAGSRVPRSTWNSVGS